MENWIDTDILHRCGKAQSSHQSTTSLTVQRPNFLQFPPHLTRPWPYTVLGMGNVSEVKWAPHMALTACEPSSGRISEQRGEPI